MTDYQNLNQKQPAKTPYSHISLLNRKNPTYTQDEVSVLPATKALVQQHANWLSLADIFCGYFSMVMP
jgi:hypothetical protein